MSKQLWRSLLVGVGISTLLLAGCGQEEKDAEKPKEEEKAVEENAEQDKGTKENSSNPLMDDPKSLQEVTDIPPEEKEALLATFDQYIRSFNTEDVDAYMETISKKPLNFKYDEEKKAVEKVFDQVDVNRKAENVKIISYHGKKADIYADLTAKTTDPKSGKEVEKSGKQVTVFNKTDEGWKVAAIFFLGDEGEKEATQ
ncbi:ketosteroid isomerase-like protein [Bacillus pakistanensis]|uniref:Ketosteroid isomerase-like protein n=1 Tax=Rossellomorea pakistanensis TaxID=992288 RepID=A0ABS2ND41_9BACI|nr:hypothetical protein [Bacillus pakistanensis]MBM7585777.1 ketosteroid isomerase-like protein [Bacillus pakistanensis]